MEEGKQALTVGVMACGGRAEAGVAVRSTRVCWVTADKGCCVLCCLCCG